MTAKKSLFNCFINAVLICFTWEVAIAQQSNEWPNLHGTDRTNKSIETNLLQEWPETGPALLWTATGLGEGYSSVAIAGGMKSMYTVLEANTILVDGKLQPAPMSLPRLLHRLELMVTNDNLQGWRRSLVRWLKRTRRKYENQL